MKQSTAMWAFDFDQIAADMRQSRVLSMAATIALVTSFS
jgi:hypothetical protein